MSDRGEGDRKRRTSITKLQRQTAVATDLIALCQAVTEDGHLEDQEIAALRQWLEENRGTDLPAVAFLLETVERILADGKVTADEARELYLAIETVLPPDIRESVRGTRLSGKRAAKEAVRQKKEVAKQAQDEARARNAAVDSWDFMVAGVRYEGRPEVISRFAEPGDTAFLVRDRTNAFSRSAVEVRLSNGMQAGYVPEQHAVDVAPLLDSGHKHGAYIKKILTGGRAPIPVIVASLYMPEADRPDAVSEQQVPASQKPLIQPPPTAGPATKSGCILFLAVLGGLTSVVAWAFARCGLIEADGAEQDGAPQLSAVLGGRCVRSGNDRMRLSAVPIRPRLALLTLGMLLTALGQLGCVAGKAVPGVLHAASRWTSIATDEWHDAGPAIQGHERALSVPPVRHRHRHERSRAGVR